jgi:hypothetical protein
MAWQRCQGFLRSRIPDSETASPVGEAISEAGFHYAFDNRELSK